MSVNKKYGLSTRIRNIRKSLGMTLREFGEKLNPPASDSLVSRWERGVNAPNRERMRQIAEIGNISVEDLTRPGTREIVTQLINRIENDVSVDPRYKELYDLNFKYDLIDEVSGIVNGNFPKGEEYKYRGLNFNSDNVILEVIRNKIYDKARTSKYLPFTNSSAIRFSSEEVNRFSYDLMRILKENEANDSMINDIEMQLSVAKHNIENLKDKYKD